MDVAKRDALTKIAGLLTHAEQLAPEKSRALKQAQPFGQGFFGQIKQKPLGSFSNSLWFRKSPNCYIFGLTIIWQFAIIINVRLLGKNIVDEFKKKHPTSRKALDRWMKLVEETDFKNPQDFKLMFGGNVDFVGNQTVFNVGGNKVRAITRIGFGVRVVIVTHVLTHTEYDRNNWKE